MWIVPIVTLAFVLLIIVLALYYSPRARMKRALGRIPRIAIAHATDGAPVKVTGRVGYDGERLTAPFSGRSCAYFEAKVEQYRSSGKNSRWVTIAREVAARDFLVRDDSGKARVEVRSGRCQVVLAADAHFRSGTFNDATPELEAFLQRHGRSSQGWVFNKTLRYSEAVIEEGEVVVVAGTARWEPDPDPDAGAESGYRAQARRLSVGPLAEGSLLVSDDPTVVTSREASA